MFCLVVGLAFFPRRDTSWFGLSIVASLTRARTISRLVARLVAIKAFATGRGCLTPSFAAGPFSFAAGSVAA